MRNADIDIHPVASLVKSLDIDWNFVVETYRAMGFGDHVGDGFERWKTSGQKGAYFYDALYPDISNDANILTGQEEKITGKVVIRPIFTRPAPVTKAMTVTKVMMETITARKKSSSKPSRRMIAIRIT